jgi:hypothetical protein
MLMVRDECLFVDGNGESITTQYSHQQQQQTNKQLSPLPSSNKQSSFTITINK